MRRRSDSTKRGRSGSTQRSNLRVPSRRGAAGGFGHRVQSHCIPLQRWRSCLGYPCVPPKPIKRSSPGIPPNCGHFASASTAACPVPRRFLLVQALQLGNVGRQGGVCGPQQDVVACRGR